MIRPILRHPAPLLSQPCAEVTDFGEGLRALAADLVETLTGRGLGLAAPQIGEPLRVVAIRTPEMPAAVVLVNPRIVASGRAAHFAERCLSVPGVEAVVPNRAGWVKVRAQDANGVEFRTRFDGLAAVVVQHELDHLSGILIASAPNRRPAPVLTRGNISRARKAMLAASMLGGVRR